MSEVLMRAFHRAACPSPEVPLLLVSRSADREIEVLRTWVKVRSREGTTRPLNGDRSGVFGAPPAVSAPDTSGLPGFPAARLKLSCWSKAPGFCRGNSFDCTAAAPC